MIAEYYINLLQLYRSVFSKPASSTTSLPDAPDVAEIKEGLSPVTRWAWPFKTTAVTPSEIIQYDEGLPILLTTERLSLPSEKQVLFGMIDAEFFVYAQWWKAVARTKSVLWQALNSRPVQTLVRHYGRALAVITRSMVYRTVSFLSATVVAHPAATVLFGVACWAGYAYLQDALYRWSRRRLDGQHFLEGELWRRRRDAEIEELVLGDPVSVKSRIQLYVEPIILRWANRFQQSIVSRVHVETTWHQEQERLLEILSAANHGSTFYYGIVASLGDFRAMDAGELNCLLQRHLNAFIKAREDSKTLATLSAQEITALQGAVAFAARTHVMRQVSR